MSESFFWTGSFWLSRWTSSLNRTETFETVRDSSSKDLQVTQSKLTFGLLKSFWLDMSQYTNGYDPMMLVFPTHSVIRLLQQSLHWGNNSDLDRRLMRGWYAHAWTEQTEWRGKIKVLIVYHCLFKKVSWWRLNFALFTSAFITFDNTSHCVIM